MVEQEKKEEKKVAVELKEEAKAEEKKEEKKPEKKAEKEIKKKDKAFVVGKDLPISKKHSMAICDYIRRKNPEEVMKKLEQVTKLRRAIPMKGEIPHRHGDMMSGRYPVNASKVFIKLLKSLQANASVNGIEEPVITVALANDASRPFKRGGSMRFKRAYVYLEAREKTKKGENKPMEEKK